jgi:hypothetical protein
MVWRDHLLVGEERERAAHQRASIFVPLLFPLWQTLYEPPRHSPRRQCFGWKMHRCYTS